MTLSAFADRACSPSLDEMLVVVGAKASLWKRLAFFMERTYGLSGEVAYYGKSFGWMLSFRKGKKPLLALYPRTDGLTAQVVLGPSLAEQASTLPLTASVRDVFDQAHPYPEGRWLFIPVTDEDEAADVEHLVLLKQKPGRQRRPQ
jgi:hypothetical protein